MESAAIEGQHNNSFSSSPMQAADSCSNPILVKDGVQDVTANDDNDATGELSIDQVSQMMREQDADLLERMHYDASQVSQYSPGVTPDLRPIDRSLPMDDAPMMLMPLNGASELQGDRDASKSTEIRVASFQDLSRSSSSSEASAVPPGEASSILLLSHASGNRPRHSRAGSLEMVKEIENVASWDGENNNENREESSDATPAASRYRRLLSGEVRSVDPVEDSNPPVEEEETTASPISVAHEAAAAALEQQQKKETGLAEQRRVREAIQFAEAVGETIAINRDDLCIIEDHTDEGESSDDDDDDGCQSKEVVVVDPEIIQDAMNASQGHLDMLHSDANTQDAQEGNNSSVLPSHVDILPRPELTRRKSKRPLWPFGPAGSDYDRFLDHLSDGLNQSNFVYKGICANPPEITKRGVQRGNYAQLHRKAWLEVSDKYHRYGKNLRLYYRYWERLGFPTNQFFDWLDSKGEAAGHPLPNLDECPRSVLDSDTVLYISNPEVTEGYALDIVSTEDGRASISDVDGNPVVTGSDGWIFILRDNVMYGAEKITSITGQSKQRFHHSSFFGGKAVAAAGIIITDEQGILTRLYPHSGHYRPGESHMQRMLFFLHRKGVDLRTFEMDTQQFRHVSREKEAARPVEKREKGKDGKDIEKKKKVDSLHMEKAVNVACFLAHKASFIGKGIFDKIHRIRKADATSVSEALELVDNGGFWSRNKDSMEKEDKEQISDRDKLVAEEPSDSH